MSTETRELSSIDRLVETEERTNPDGTVNVTIEGWDEIHQENPQSYVRVHFELIDSAESEKMKFPQPGGDLTNYKFYRLVKSCGLDMRNADLLEGSAARAEKKGDEWRLVVPDHTTTTEQASDALGRVWGAATAPDWPRIIMAGMWSVALLALSLGVLALV